MVFGFAADTSINFAAKFLFAFAFCRSSFFHLSASSSSNWLYPFLPFLVTPLSLLLKNTFKLLSKSKSQLPSQQQQHPHSCCCSSSDSNSSKSLVMSCCGSQIEKQASQPSTSTTSPPSPSRPNPFLTRNAKPVLPNNSLSVIEQVFFQSDPKRPQVIMGFVARMRCPKSVKKFTIKRIIEILQLAASEHHRLSCYIDPDTITTHPLCETAQDLPALVSVYPKVTQDTWKKVYMTDLNTNFEVGVKKPLWRTSIIVPPHVLLEEADDFINDDLLKQELREKFGNSSGGVDGKKQDAISSSDVSTHEGGSNHSPNSHKEGFQAQIVSSSSNTPNNNHEDSTALVKLESTPVEGDQDGGDQVSFELIWTIHHCLGDALSMFAFARSFFKICTADKFNVADLELSKYKVNTEPPPLLDNLIEPNILEVAPVAFGMMVNHFLKKKGDRFRGHSLSDIQEEEVLLKDHDLMIVPPQMAIKLPPAAIDTSTAAISNSLPVIVAPSPRSPVQHSKVVPEEEGGEHHLQKQQQHQPELQPALSSDLVPLIKDTTSTTTTNEDHHNSNDTSSNKHLLQLVPSSSSASAVVGFPKLSSESATRSLVSVPRSLTPMPFATQTRARFLWFESDLVSLLRKKCKQEGTTVAAAIVVSALAAVRATFAQQAKYKSHPLPAHQGWVVTNSMRHLLPTSQLLYGADKETDPGTNMFGGYAGSVMNSSLKLVDTHDYWERCRTVRRDISFVFRASIRRMKVANYCYRHPKVWQYVQDNTDLSKLSRSYSVEVANVGAWKNPAAPGKNADPNDPRLRLEYFQGLVNSSFDGVRGLFTLGVSTIGGDMSIGIAYDTGAIHEKDADVFAAALEQGLRRVGTSEGRRITIMEASQ